MDPHLRNGLLLLVFFYLPLAFVLFDWTVSEDE